MFPDVHSQQWLMMSGQWIACIRCIQYRNFMIFLNKPSPARTEVSSSLCAEFFQKLVNTAPFVHNSVLEITLRLVFIGSHAVPIKRVIPMLRCIVEYFLILAPKLYSNVTKAKCDQVDDFPIMFS